MTNVIDLTLQAIEQNKINAETGVYNCIPCPLPTFAQEFVGLEQKRLGVITGSDKSSKTQFTNFLGVFTVLDYIRKNKQVDAKILYFALEESEDMIVARYILYLLKIRHNIICNYRELMSISSTINPNIYSIVKSQQMRQELEFFNDHVVIKKTDDIEKMLKLCKAFAENNGKYDSNNNYIPDNPGLYKIVIIDHVSLVSPLPGKSLFETIKTLFHRLITFRDAYNFTFLVVQQQSATGESLEAKKADEVMPTKATLADYRSSSNDVNFMIGIFNPTKVSKDTFGGYIIKEGSQPVLGDNARFIKMMVQRQGPSGGQIGLYTDGPNAYFEELPPARGDDEALGKLYARMRLEKAPKPRGKQPQQGQTKFAFMARILNSIKLTKTKKVYSIDWEKNKLPEIIEVDGNFLGRGISTNQNPCKFCWFTDKCSGNIPCTPTTFWEPVDLQDLQDAFGKDIEIEGYAITSDNQLIKRTELNNGKQQSTKTRKKAVGFELSSQKSE